jgi:hypothetical protein
MDLAGIKENPKETPSKNRKSPAKDKNEKEIFKNKESVGGWTYGIKSISRDIVETPGGPESII